MSLPGLFFAWLLDYQDSNLDKQNQNLLCYHYTIVQTYVLSVKKRCKDREYFLINNSQTDVFYVLFSNNLNFTRLHLNFFFLTEIKFLSAKYRPTN